MSIDRISLKNFKCFAELDISLSKLTLLTGENSSGKSSVLYGILSVFQSDGFPLYLSPNGKYVNMGDFREISFKNRRDSKVEIGIAMSDARGREHSVESIWAFDRSSNMPRLHDLRVRTHLIDLRVRAENGHYVLIFSCDQEVYVQSGQMALLEAAITAFERLKNQHDEDADADALLRSMEQSVGEPERIKGQRFDSLDEFQNGFMEANNFGAWFLVDSHFDTLSDGDKRLNFIGSFRLQPERAYYQRAVLQNKVGVFGENHIEQISEWETRRSPEFDELKSILRGMNLMRTMRSRKLRGGRFEYRVQVASRGTWASLPDVGFGISQFLPVVVADLQLPRRSTLMVAQPEIHLHPSAQAAMADYFVNQVKERENQYILETHSEYLLNRVRLAIVKGEIDPSDVSVYYFENSTDGSIVHQVEFTLDGQIKNAPEGFFKTYMMDVMNIALNAS